MTDSLPKGQARPATGARGAAAMKTNSSTPPTQAEPPREPTADEVRHAFESGEYPYADKMGRGDYEQQKAQLQAELLKVQLWAQETGQKFVMLSKAGMRQGKVEPSNGLQNT